MTNDLSDRARSVYSMRDRLIECNAARWAAQQASNDVNTTTRLLGLGCAFAGLVNAITAGMSRFITTTVAIAVALFVAGLVLRIRRQKKIERSRLMDYTHKTHSMISDILKNPIDHHTTFDEAAAQLLDWIAAIGEDDIVSEVDRTHRTARAAAWATGIYAALMATLVVTCVLNPSTITLTLTGLAAFGLAITMHSAWNTRRYLTDLQLELRQARAKGTPPPP